MIHSLRRGAYALLIAALLAPLVLVSPRPAMAQAGAACLPEVASNGGQGGRPGGDPSSPSMSPAPMTATTFTRSNAVQSCMPTGEAFADSERLDDTRVAVRLGVQNGDQAAATRLQATVPTELAASSTCEMSASGFGRIGSPGTPTAPVPVTVAANGLLVTGPGGPVMPPGARVVFDCVLPIVENCGLVATISIDWLDLSGGPVMTDPLSLPAVFSAFAETPVSPPCETEEDTTTRTRIRLGITAEASPRSVLRGEITTWHVTVTNYGNRIMNNAVVTDVLHEALVAPRTLPDGASWDEATRTLRIPVPSLAPGESTTISFPTQVIAWSQVPNTFLVHSGRHTATAHADVFGLIDYFS